MGACGHALRRVRGAFRGLNMSKAINALCLVGALALTSCASAPQLDADALLSSVELSGDIRCEGSGELSLLGFLVVHAEGLSAAGGSATGAAGDACAGVAITLGPYRWQWVSATQESEACAEYAGTMTVKATP